jgi:hypothetical protein
MHTAVDANRARVGQHNSLWQSTFVRFIQQWACLFAAAVAAMRFAGRARAGPQGRGSAACVLIREESVGEFLCPCEQQHDDVDLRL